MNNIEELKDEEVKAVLKLTQVRNKIANIERDKLLPALKKKYEGKYFKYKNTYSCPKSDKDKWWMYIKITKVSQLNWMNGFTFQTDMYGKVSVEKEKAISTSICQVAITKREFETAYNKMLLKIDNIYNGK